MISKNKKKKKILLLARALDSQSAGIHVYVKNLINHLELYGNHDRYEYTIIRVDSKITLPLKKVKQVFFKNKFHLPGYAAFRLFFLVPLYANKNNFDAVVELSHFGPFNLKKKIKRITVIHDLTPILFRKLHSFASSFLQKLFLPGIIKRADLIVSNSKNTENDIKSVYPKSSSKVSTIYLGIESNLSSKKTNPKTLENYNIKNEFILYLGTIEPRKNLTVLIKGFEIFKDKTKSKIQLVLAGKEGWKNEEFFKILDKSKYKDHITLTGYVKEQDIHTLLSTCKVFIYPSVYEGFGLPVAEALNTNTQVICANNSSLLEFGEEFVSYFDTNDPNSLSNCIEEILIQQKTKKINLVKLREKYNWESYVSNFENDLKLILQ